MFDHFGRIAHHDRVGQHVAPDQGIGRHDAVVADRDARHDDAVVAQKAVLANVGVAPFAVDEIMAQHDRAPGHRTIVADVDAPGVGLVEPRAQRNADPLANLHAIENAVESPGQPYHNPAHQGAPYRGK